MNNYNNIPDELKILDQWMLSFEGIPRNLEGIKTDATNPDNWNTFDEIIKNTNNKYDIAFCLNNDYVIVDLDDCFNDDMELREWAKSFLGNIKNPYLEISRRGKGLHAIFNITNNFKDKKGLNVRMYQLNEKWKNEPQKCGVEIYSHSKAFVLTGNVYNEHFEINQNSKDLIYLYKELEKVKKIKPNEKRKYNKDSSSDIFSYINNQLHIIDIISYYGLSVNHSNKINCPFHSEKTDSLQINTLQNYWYCFGCNQGGDLIKFVALKEDINNFAAAKFINDKFNLGIDFNRAKEDYNKNLDLLNIKWNPDYVFVEFTDLEKRKKRLSDYFQFYKDVEEKPPITKIKVLPVEENITCLLNHYSLNIKYNMIKMDYEVFENNKYLDILSRQVINIKNLCEKHFFNINEKHLESNLTFIGQKNKYNPWEDYLKSCHSYYCNNPDKEIFNKLLDTVISNNKYKNKYIGKFLLQMVYIGCSKDNDSIACDYILVLQGPQFIGKTTWLQNLLPNHFRDNYFLSGRSLDLTNKDSIMETVSNILVEMGEIATTFKKSDQEAIKNFITAPRDKFRIPYAPTAIVQKRRVCLAATTNDVEYLRDLTGTRRYLTLNCIDFDKKTKIDVDMLWGYFYNLYLRKASYKFDYEEVKEINQINMQYLNKSEKILLIEESFDLYPGEDEGSWYTANELFNYLPSQGLLNKFTLAKELKKTSVIFRVNRTKTTEFFIKLIL